MEGSRTFDQVWGLATGAACLALAIPILWWRLPAHRRSFFGETVDPHGRLQLGYGVFCMATAFTNVGCRFIPHGALAYVHPAFFVVTVALVVGLGPRVLALAHSTSRSTARRSC